MPLKIAVPDLVSNSYFPAVAAIELGFFKEEGLDVALEPIFPVDKTYAALREGQIDLVGGSAQSAPRPLPRRRRVGAQLAVRREVGRIEREAVGRNGSDTAGHAGRHGRA